MKHLISIITLGVAVLFSPAASAQRQPDYRLPSYNNDTQKLGYFAWAAAEGESTPATADTVERALAAAIATVTARYPARWLPSGIQSGSGPHSGHGYRPEPIVTGNHHGNPGG